MTLLDAYALVAFVANEPAASDVEPLLRRNEARVVVVNLAEAIDVLQRVYGVPPEDVRKPLAGLLLRGALSARESTESDAWLAADIRVRHYRRRESPLSMADCLLLARAATAEEAVATADRPVAEAALAEGIEIISLPDSAGSRPV